MFVQVIDCRLKDGKREEFVSLMEAWDRNNPKHVVMIGKFGSAEKAAKNSSRPEITANYHRMLALLESEPTFVDGDLVLQVKAPSAE